jgi:TRAP-type mannitol/chloroaromatic compound transport system permease large subunit
MQMAFITPPYGLNLFYMKGVVPKSITMMDLYKSSLPFVGIQAIALALVIIFPDLALWLPRVLFAK